MSSEARIFLPWRPAQLPHAQRLASWGEQAGWRVCLEIVQRLPEVSGLALALGDFPEYRRWQDGSPHRHVLDPLDWPTLARWAQEHWPLSTMPLSDFGDGTRRLPGEDWRQDRGLALDLAPPEWALLQQAHSRGLTLATAESCTAGGVAARVAALPGSSAVLQAGLVTYANLAKESLLGVQTQTLERYGAVSEAVVLEMLAGALRFGDLALAISGIAGPGGAVPGKPIGTVCIAWGQRGEPGQAAVYHFPGDRWAVQYAAGSVALGNLIALLMPR